MKTLPLFPLNTVLFPGMLLPIHVFEKRYLDMVSAVAGEGQSFGVVLIKEGQEIGEPATPHSVGTSAQVIRAERADDGSVDIIVVGRSRFVISSIVQERPHLLSVAETYPLLQAQDPRVPGLLRKVKEQLSVYMTLLQSASPTAIHVESLPDEAEIMAWVVGMALQISLAERQRLLECPDLPTLLSKELELLTLEQKLLQYIASTQEQDRENLSPFFTWSSN